MTTTTTNYNANDYEYRVAWSEEDKLYVGRVTEFPSLAAHGDSPEDALSEIKAVVGYVIEDIVESGDTVPEPLSRKDYSGRFNVRLPKDLHRELAADAARQGVSLNQLIVARLAYRR